jgi:hypothetical protein
MTFFAKNDSREASRMTCTSNIYQAFYFAKNWLDLAYRLRDIHDIHVEYLIVPKKSDFYCNMAMKAFLILNDSIQEVVDRLFNKRQSIEISMMFNFLLK